MKAWQRKFLFLFFLFLFLTFGPIVLFYSLGYRFDFEKKKITKTGGIFVKALPKEVEVSIDNKIKKKTDPFFGSVLIENLLPKKYKVRVEKEGYFPWEKELEVKEEMVTEVKNLILFPKNLNFSQILDGVEKFWILPNGKELILKEGGEKWALKSFSLEKRLKSFLIGKDDLPKGAEFLDLNFGENSDQIEIKVKIKEGIKSFILDLKKSPPQLREKEKFPENVICFKKSKENFYFFDKSGYIFLGEKRLNEEPLALVGDCQLEIFDGSVLLESQGTLYFLKEGKFEKIFENLKGIEVAPESKKVAIFTDYEIWIFEKERVEFLNRFSKKIEKVYWFNENYLILLFHDKIVISEIDKRDKINTFELADFSGDDFYFNRSNKKIYFRKENSIFESETLLR